MGVRSLADRLAAPLILFLIVVGFYWKLVLTDQFTWLAGPDLTNQVLPWFQFQAGEWHAGRIPLWDPYHWGGQPLIGQGQPGVAYPLNWILFNLPLRNGWIRAAYLHWYLVVIHYMAALFCFFLCRDLGLSRRAAVIAGLVFALGGYIGTHDWPQMINGAVWAPLVFLFLLRMLRGERPAGSAALSGLFLGVAWLSGHHQIPIYISLAVGVVLLAAFFGSRAPAWKIAGLGALLFAFSFLGGAVQLLPAYEYGQLARRWVGAPATVGWADTIPYTVHRTYSFNPLAILGVAVPGLNRHADGYVGVAALSLAALGVMTRWREPLVRLFTAVSCFGLLLALGGMSLVHGVLYAVVPLVEKARSPSMAIFIFSFGMAPLIAWGVDALRGRDDASTLRGLSKVLTAVAVLFFIGLLYFAANGKLDTEDRLVMTGFFALGAAALYAASAHGALSAGWVASALALVMLMEVSNVSTYGFAHRDEANRMNSLTALGRHVDLVEHLRSLPGPLRVEVAGEDIEFNLGDWHGLETSGGYLASLTANIERHRYFHLLSTGYAVGRKQPDGWKEEAFTSSEGIKIFQNRAVFPRTWVAGSVKKAQNQDELAQDIMQGNLDLRKVAVMAGDTPEFKNCENPGESRVLELVPGRTLVYAKLACPAMVVVSQTWYPGWEARVSGERKRVWETYGALQGVVAGPGEHLIELRYRPGSVLLGALLTAVAVLAAVGLNWRTASSMRRATAA